jgi:hypothetical protein
MNRAIVPEHATLLSPLFTLVGFFAAESKFQQRPRKARGRISADHSRACRAPAPFAPPRPAPPRRGERGEASERARVALHSLSSHPRLGE